MSRFSCDFLFFAGVVVFFFTEIIVVVQFTLGRRRRFRAYFSGGFRRFFFCCCVVSGGFVTFSSTTSTASSSLARRPFVYIWLVIASFLSVRFFVTRLHRVPGLPGHSVLLGCTCVRSNFLCSFAGSVGRGTIAAFAFAPTSSPTLRRFFLGFGRRSNLRVIDRIGFVVVGDIDFVNKCFML